MAETKRNLPRCYHERQVLARIGWDPMRVVWQCTDCGDVHDLNPEELADMQPVLDILAARAKEARQ